MIERQYNSTPATVLTSCAPRSVSTDLPAFNSNSPTAWPSSALPCVLSRDAFDCCLRTALYKADKTYVSPSTSLTSEPSVSASWPSPGTACAMSAFENGFSRFHCSRGHLKITDLGCRSQCHCPVESGALWQQHELPWNEKCHKHSVHISFKKKEAPSPL